MKHYNHTTGWKATDKNMRCQGFQFELGKWYRHEGDIDLCKTGFHFCKYPSGPWVYYQASTTRIFRVEAKDVYEEYMPGVDLKLVCREIRLTEELKASSNRNTGYGNTGNMNTGYSNTGDWNGCDFETGFFNPKSKPVETVRVFGGLIVDREKFSQEAGFAICNRVATVFYRRDGKRYAMPYKLWWDVWASSLTRKEKEAVKKLSGFDADVFFEITGVRL